MPEGEPNVKHYVVPFKDPALVVTLVAGIHS